MNALTPNLQLELGSTSFFPGHVFGRRQPSLLVRLRARTHAAVKADLRPKSANLQVLSQTWLLLTGVELKTQVLADGPEPWPEFAAQLAMMTTELLRAGHLCVVDPPQVLRAPAMVCSTQWTYVLLAVAPGREQATQMAWIAVLKAAQYLWLDESSGSVLANLKEVLTTLKRFAPIGSNTPRFLAAAYENDIPVLPLGQEVFQYGQGRSAQWFDSTFTLRTPNIGVRLARDKQATSARLRQAGLPVPLQQAVLNADLAVEVARKIGYPVVIKPADLDGGQGVAAGLKNDEQVRKAFERAQSISKRVLIEKHVTGRDYRLTVLDSQLLWAIERQPAGVTGDGFRSVQSLVDLENSHPARGEGPHAVLKRLQIDDEAQEMLTEQRLALSDVPKADQFVVLRRIANVATGGRPVAVNSKIHPDNAQLAVRAAEALRLDLAGVDLLIEDISRSWHETGAAICEVNAQPQLGATTGPHLYGQILKQRLGPCARIPILVVMEDCSQGQLARAIADQLNSEGYNTGCINSEGAFLGQELLLAAREGALAGGRLLLTHPKVDALIYSLFDDQVLRTGLPFDRFNWLVVAGMPVRGSSQRMQTPLSADSAGLIKELWSCILPSCTEQVLQLQDFNLLDKHVLSSVLTCETTNWEGLVERLRLRWYRQTSVSD
jgi:cyanophycin synthetase